MMSSNPFRHYLRAMSLMPLFLIAAAAVCEPLRITNVSLDRQVLVAPEQQVGVRFQISEKSTVDLKIYDARGYEIWRQTAAALPAGEHVIAWSGVDSHGKAVSPEVYFYTVEAMTADDEKTIFDLTDSTGGESLRLDDVHYDAGKKKVTFTAAQTGRYFLRAGVSQAFAINTLVNNKVLEAGRYELPWDGDDVSHVFNVANHPKLLLGGFGYRLSANAIIVKSTNVLADMTRPSTWIDVSADTPRRVRAKDSRQGVDPGFYRSVDRYRDVALKLVLPATLAKTADGIPIIVGATPVRIELSDVDAEVMEAQRGEVVFFWDNQLIYDNEVSYYPYTFNWTPPVLDGQPHLLTGFVAGFAGNIALATVKVQLGEPDRNAGGKNDIL